MVKYLFYEYKGKTWPQVCWDEAKPIPKEGECVTIDGTEYRIVSVRCENVRDEKKEMIEEHHHIVIGDC
jgi:hypothetical protein